MTFTIQSIQSDLATGRVIVSLTKPVGKPFPDTVIVQLCLQPIPSETEDALIARGRQAAKRALQDALASL